MKKLIGFILAGITAHACMFGMVGCKDNAANPQPQVSLLKASMLGIGGGGLFKLEGSESLR